LFIARHRWLNRLKIVQLYKILSKYEYSAVRRSDLETFEKIMAKRNKEKVIRKVTRFLPGNGPQLSLKMASVFTTIP
jgi:hypothetical protein